MDEIQEEKQVLMQQQSTGDALRELQLHHGWKEVERILSDIYKESVETLIAGESAEARATLKVIENLTTQFRLKIQHAQVASEELKKEKFITMPVTPDA